MKRISATLKEFLELTFSNIPEMVEDAVADAWNDYAKADFYHSGGKKILRSGFSHAEDEAKQHFNTALSLYHSVKNILSTDETFLQKIDSQIADIHAEQKWLERYCSSPSPHWKIKPEERNILDFPHSINKSNENSVITLGDLHGHSMKFIYFLIAEDVIQLSPEQYQELWEIYQTPVSRLTQDHIEKWKNIIEKAPLNHVRKVRLLGDILSERNGNDGLNLILFFILWTRLLKIIILISNHDMEFFVWFAHLEKIISGERTLNYSPDLQLQHQSFISFTEFLRKFPEYKHTIYEAVKHYKKNIQVMDYTLEEKNSITLFTHAPAGLEIIHPFAAYLKTKYSNRSLSKLKETIDGVNQAFKKIDFVDMFQQEQKERKEKKKSSSKIIPEQYPLTRITHNRDKHYHSLKLAVDSDPYYIHLVHGHLGPSSPTYPFDKSILNLDDTCLGKSEDRTTDLYLVLRQDMQPALRLTSSARFFNSKQQDVPQSLPLTTGLSPEASPAPGR